MTATDFPKEGDNFRTVGPWRILSGSGWKNWQMAAISAEIASSRFHEDAFTAARQARSFRARTLEPTDVPALSESAD